MSPERHQELLLQSLASFIRWSIRECDGHVDPHFSWPPESAPLQTRFHGYTWARSTHHHRPIHWAIAPLGCRWPSSLHDIEPAIFNPAAYGQGVSGLHSDELDYFLILEILDPRTVRSCLAMQIERRDWYLLDEHVLQIP
jgi:hypothetical protein